MRVADLVTATFLMLVGGVVLYDAVRLGIGWGTDGPRSGFFPFWLALLMMASCTVIVLQALRRHAGASFATREQLTSVAKVLGPAVALVAVTEWIGLYVASAFYIGFSMRWIGRHRWVTVILVSIGIPLAIFFIFEKWFLVPMPKGPLENWLGQ